MTGQDVFVLGGGNSAGQSALHLARYARHVTLLVRGPVLADSMSDYLIEQIRGTRNIDIVYRAAVVGARAQDDSLAEIEIAYLDETRTEVVPAAGLFVFIGSTPHTDWLDDAVQRDATGFVLVGPDVDPRALDDPERTPLPLETSVPGVFAVGDARRGSIKRVATAVGDGAAVVDVLRRYLAAEPTAARAAV
jgi:thioredoxin reductase (NADPH)